MVLSGILGLASGMQTFKARGTDAWDADNPVPKNDYVVVKNAYTDSLESSATLDGVYRCIICQGEFGYFQKICYRSEEAVYYYADVILRVPLHVADPSVKDRKARPPIVLSHNSISNTGQYEDLSARPAWREQGQAYDSIPVAKGVGIARLVLPYPWQEQDVVSGSTIDFQKATLRMLPESGGKWVTRERPLPPRPVTHIPPRSPEASNKPNESAEPCIHPGMLCFLFVLAIGVAFIFCCCCCKDTEPSPEEAEAPAQDVEAPEAE